MLFWILLTFFTQNISAQNSCDSNNSVGTTIVYTNGVATYKWEAENTLAKINSLLTSDDKKKIDPKGVEFIKAYNFSFTESLGKNGIIFDLLETYYQKTQEAGIPAREAWAKFNEYKSKYFVPLLSVADGLGLEALVDDLITQVTLITSNSTTVDDIKTLWQTEALDKNRRVFAVSHSQGGLFINEVYEKLKAEKPASELNKIKLFAIADPASTVEGAKVVADSYITYKYDLVIKVVANALKGNSKYSQWNSLLETFLRGLPLFVKWTAYVATSTLLSLDLKTNLEKTAGFHSIDNFYISKNYNDLREEVRTKMVKAGAIATCGDFTIAQEPFFLDPNLIRFTALNSASAPSGCDPKDPKCSNVCDPKTQNCLTYTWSIVTKNAEGKITSNKILGSSAKPFIWYRANGQENNILRVEATDGNSTKSSEIEYSVGQSAICGGEPGWYYNFDQFSDLSPASTQSGGFVSDSSSVTGLVFLSADSWLCQGSSVNMGSISGSKLYGSSVTGVMMSRSTLYYSHVSGSMVNFAILTNVNASHCNIIGAYSNDSCSYDVWASESANASAGF